MWRVSAADQVEAGSQLIRVEDLPALRGTQICLNCNAESVVGYGLTPERRWRHLEVCQLESEIVCALPHGQYKACQKIYVVRVP